LHGCPQEVRNIKEEGETVNAEEKLEQIRIAYDAAVPKILPYARTENMSLETRINGALTVLEEFLNTVEKVLYHFKLPQ
jgi:hypothetical protein